MRTIDKVVLTWFLLGFSWGIYGFTPAATCSTDTQCMVMHGGDGYGDD
jgi:hypothetical protein